MKFISLKMLECSLQFDNSKYLLDAHLYQVYMESNAGRTRSQFSEKINKNFWKTMCVHTSLAERLLLVGSHPVLSIPTSFEPEIAILQIWCFVHWLFLDQGLFLLTPYDSDPDIHHLMERGSTGGNLNSKCIFSTMGNLSSCNSVDDVAKHTPLRSTLCQMWSEYLFFLLAQ